jgi:LuxR family maltose regulon positive regulatory protein
MDGELPFLRETEYIVLARILMAQGRLDETTRLLQRLLKAAEAGGRISRVIEILMLQALSFQAQRDTDQAINTLERALTLAEPGGYIRIFVDEGLSMAKILQQAAARGIAVDYLRKLLAAFLAGGQRGREAGEKEGTLAPLPPRSPALIEPLSERELEVLQLIAAGLTNQEIGSRLFLSLNTVKVHTRNIYGKLGAHSRTQAVARARTLGVLPSI